MARPRLSERDRLFAASERIGVPPSIAKLYVSGERTPAPWVQRVLAEYGLTTADPRPFRPKRGRP